MISAGSRAKGLSHLSGTWCWVPAALSLSLIQEEAGVWAPCLKSTLVGKTLSCCSVAQWWPTLCDPMDCGTSGFPVLHYLSKLVQTHVHQVDDAIQPSYPVFPFSSCLQSFPASGSFPMSQFFISGGQSIGASASASFLPMNIQD